MVKKGFTIKTITIKKFSSYRQDGSLIDTYAVFLDGKLMKDFYYNDSEQNKFDANKYADELMEELG